MDTSTENAWPFFFIISPNSGSAQTQEKVEDSPSPNGELLGGTTLKEGESLFPSYTWSYFPQKQPPLESQIA